LSRIDSGASSIGDRENGKIRTFGVGNEVRSPADYDGDNKNRIPGDIPTPNAFVRRYLKLLYLDGRSIIWGGLLVGKMTPERAPGTLQR